jgi:hypothetical protein
MILILMADHYSIIIAGSPRRKVDKLCIGHDHFCDPFQGLELVLDLAPTKRATVDFAGSFGQSVCWSHRRFNEGFGTGTWTRE